MSSRRDLRSSRRLPRAPPSHAATRARTGRVVRAARRELQHRGRDGLQEPAIVGDEIAASSVSSSRSSPRGSRRRGGSSARRAEASPDRPRASAPRRALSSPPRGCELPLEVLVAKPEPTRSLGDSVATVQPAGVLDSCLRLGVPAHGRFVVCARRSISFSRRRSSSSTASRSRAPEDVLPEREVELARSPLVVEGETGPPWRKRARLPAARSRPRSHEGASSCRPRSARRARAGRGDRR